MALGERRSRESPWSFPRQTNKQIDKQKNSAAQRFELSTLADLAQCSYGLSYRTVIIWLLLSDYFCQNSIILDLIEILIQSGSPDNCYQDPAGCPGSQPSCWWTLPSILRNLANKQTNKQKMALGERRSHESPWSFPRQTNKQTNKQTDKQKILSTQRFEL